MYRHISKLPHTHINKLAHTLSPTCVHGHIFACILWLPTEGQIPVPIADRLADLVVKASASGAEDPGFESRL